MEVGEVEEAAERRARNLQRRQNQMETEVADSPGLERQGSSTNRRSVGGISGLSHAQLAEHYQHCLKLSARSPRTPLTEGWTSTTSRSRLVPWTPRPRSMGSEWTLCTMTHSSWHQG